MPGAVSKPQVCRPLGFQRAHPGASAGHLETFLQAYELGRNVIGIMKRVMEMKGVWGSLLGAGDLNFPPIPGESGT